MFDQTFKAQLAKITTDTRLIEKLWKEIEVQYSKSGRFYHTLSHLDNLIVSLTPVLDNILDWQTIVLSIAYHDIVYNPLKKDNEEKSAELANKRLVELGASKFQREKCFSQIMATKTHSFSNDSDTNYFTDADLSILGSDDDDYVRYAQLIRKEYKYFPDLLYKPGRKKVLMRFLEMTNIFKTKHFQNKYERQARLNLTNELRSLS